MQQSQSNAGAKRRTAGQTRTNGEIAANLNRSPGKCDPVILQLQSDSTNKGRPTGDWAIEIAQFAFPGKFECFAEYAENGFLSRPKGELKLRIDGHRQNNAALVIDMLPN